MSSPNHPRSLSRKLSASLLSILSPRLQTSAPTSPDATSDATDATGAQSPPRPRADSRASVFTDLSTLSTSTNASLARIAKQFRRVRNYRRRETIRPGFHPFNLPSSTNSSLTALQFLNSPHDLSLHIATPTPNRISRASSDYPVRFPSSEWSAWSDLGEEEDWFARPPAPRQRAFSDTSTISESSFKRSNVEYEEDAETCIGHGHDEERPSLESLIDPRAASFSSSPPSSSFSHTFSYTSGTSSRVLSTSSTITFPSSSSSHQIPLRLRKSGPVRPPKTEPRGSFPRGPTFARAQSRTTPGYVDEEEDVFGEWREGMRRNSAEW